MESKNACAIRYCPDAKLITDFDAEDINRADFFRFKALYLILDEEDSEEFYADGGNRLFKLDNAEAFKLFSTAELLIRKGKTKSQWVKMSLDEDIDKRIAVTNDQFYAPTAEQIFETLEIIR